MKKLFRSFFAALVALNLSAIAFAATGLTVGLGITYSPNYNYGIVAGVPPLRVISGTNSTGVGTVTLSYGYFTTPDGRQVFPFTNLGTTLSIPAITIDSGANQETVTPSSVSCSTPIVISTCQITATFTYVHGVGAQIVSGDGGVTEAINDVAQHNGGAVYWEIDSGKLTLSTGSQSTTFGSYYIPTRSVVSGASLIVDTTITGCSGGWSLGYTSGVEFTAANTTLTAGTSTDSSTIKVPVAMTSAAIAPEVYCTTSAATAGVVHAKVWGYKVVAPQS